MRANAPKSNVAQEDLGWEQQEHRKHKEELQNRLRRDRELYKIDAEKKRREIDTEGKGPE